MMTQLLESGARRHAPRGGWTVASVTIHGAVITAAVALTLRDPVETVQRIPLDPIRYVVARPRPVEPAPITASPSLFAMDRPDLPVLTVPPVTPVGIPPIGGSTRIDATEFGSGAPLNPGGDRSAPSGVHTVATVDRIVAPLPGNPGPEYPSSLRSAAVEGEVLVQFVVDTTGRVVPGSVAIMRATHPLFGESVRRWLLKTRYVPAEAGGRRVSQLVQQPIGFSLRR